MSANSSRGGGGGVKALADADAKNATFFFTCSLNPGLVKLIMIILNQGLALLIFEDDNLIVYHFKKK